MRGFAHIVEVTTHALGSVWAVGGSILFTIGWLFMGPVFDFSDTWQLWANTITTIITFIMVFVIQASQNRDGLAIQAKLDELIRAIGPARNLYIGLDHASEQEIRKLRGDE